MSDAQGELLPGQWRRELDDFVRGISGGFLFGIPLLYTMEAWWIGTHSEPWRLLLLLLFSFAINYMLGHFAGFRKGSTAANVATDALEAIAIGVVASTVTLMVLGELRPGLPFDTMIGIIALESVPFSLGVSIANGFLRGTKDDPKGENGGGSEGDEQDEGDERRQEASTGQEQANGTPSHPQINGTLRDAGATIAGALFISFSIAPTEEVPMLTSNLSAGSTIALICFSLLVSYAITFEAGFADQKARLQQVGVFQRPLSETVFSYLVSLLVAGLLLFLLKQLEVADPWHVWLERMVVLGLPATIGGSAGRLAVGG